MEQYLDTIYRYFPQDKSPSDLDYSYTQEIKRFFELGEKLKREHGNFERLCAVLEKRLGMRNTDYSFIGDNCRTVMAAIPASYGISRFPLVVINVSGMVDYYSTYLTKQVSFSQITTLEDETLDENEQKLVNDLANIVNEFYLNFKPFPMEYYAKEVPLIFSSKRYNELATYYECLMTTHILP